MFHYELMYLIIQNSLKNYGLCPSHYSSAPGLSWDAMLKMTKIKPELITDLDMYMFFDKRYGVEFLTFLVDITQPTINI